MSKTNFLGTTQFGEAQKNIWGALPPNCHYVATGQRVMAHTMLC